MPWKLYKVAILFNTARTTQKTNQILYNLPRRNARNGFNHLCYFTKAVTNIGRVFNLQL